MTFRVGQKVVCIDDSPSWLGDLSALERNKVYTVAAVFEHGITVGEIETPSPYLWFSLTRFRPIVEPKTDISIFTQMLKPSKVNA